MKEKKATLLSDEKIISLYTNHILTKGQKPSSVYDFAQTNGFEEADFYKFFASFDVLEKRYLVLLFQHTIDLLQQNKAYAEYSSAEKLSCFYFTFFEVATANRSFVCYLLQTRHHTLKNLPKLSQLKASYTSYALQILEKPFPLHQQTAIRIQDSILQEAAWWQFLSILQFWLHDTSAGFEKTDVLIEKSVKASFDLVYHLPTKSVLDFGKFLWKERFSSVFSPAQ